jgi:hypothetical protein
METADKAGIPGALPADAVFDTAQNNKLSAQSDVAAQSAAVFNTAQTPVAQSTDVAAQSAAVFYTAQTPVAQSTDPLYTAPWLHLHAAQTAAASDTEPPQSMALFQAPRKALAAQPATPYQAEVARKLSGSFSEAAGKPPLSPRVMIMMEQSTEIIMQMLEIRNRGETLEDEKREMERQRDEAVNKFDRLQATLRSLESFAEDKVRENKAQQEKIAERDSHIMILSETCRDVQEQLAELQDSQIEAEVYGNNVRANMQAQQLKREEAMEDSTVYQSFEAPHEAVWPVCGVPEAATFGTLTPVYGMTTPPGVTTPPGAMSQICLKPLEQQIPQSQSQTMGRVASKSVDAAATQLLKTQFEAQHKDAEIALLKAQLETQRKDSEIELLKAQLEIQRSKNATRECGDIGNREQQHAPRHAAPPRPREKVTLNPVSDVKRKIGEQIPDIYDVVRRWTRDLSRHCNSAEVDPQGHSIWVLKALGAITEGGNLHAILQKYNTDNLEDPEDIMNWTWEQFVGCLFSSVLAKGVDPLKYKTALEDIECEGTDEQALEDLLFNYQVKFDDYERHESRKSAIAASPGAVGQRRATAAQQLYDKCPPNVQTVMNDYPHNVELRRTRTDLDQMYTDLTRVKTSPLIGLLASTVVGAVAVPKEDIWAAAVNAKHAEKTSTRIGAESDYVVVMKVNQASVLKFEKLLSSRADMTKFIWRKLPNKYGDSTMFVVVHPVRFELESFSNSEECRNCGATPGRLGVRLNVDISKEERDALIKELDKNSRSRKYSAVVATQEPTSATNREDILLSLVQELRDVLKQSNLTASTQSLANSVVASSIGPNDSASMIGSQNSQNSTVLAQAANTGFQDSNTSITGRPPMFQQPHTGTSRHFSNVAVLPLHGNNY